MPAIFIPIAIFLGSIVSSLVGRVLLALGVGFATYTGFDYLLDGVKQAIVSNFGNVPADMLAIVAALRIDQAITVILSAFAARFAINAVMGANRKFAALPGGD